MEDNTMKKKIFALLMVICFVFAMAAGCNGASETDSGEDKTGTESEAPAESETSDVVLTADTEITDEDIQEIYASIKESIEKRYLEPNNIAPEDFNWPAEDSEVWNYRELLNSTALLNMFSWENSDFIIENISEEDINLLIEDLNEIDDYSSPEKDILDCVLLGVIDWLSSKVPFETEYFDPLWGTVYPSYSTLSNNITFTE